MAVAAAAFLIAAAAAPELSAREIYQWVDDKGVTHFTDRWDQLPRKVRLQLAREGRAPADQAEAAAAQDASLTPAEALDQLGVDPSTLPPEMQAQLSGAPVIPRSPVQQEAAAPGSGKGKAEASAEPSVSQRLDRMLAEQQNRRDAERAQRDKWIAQLKQARRDLIMARRDLAEIAEATQNINPAAQALRLPSAVRTRSYIEKQRDRAEAALRQAETRYAQVKQAARRAGVPPGLIRAVEKDN